MQKVHLPKLPIFQKNQILLRNEGGPPDRHPRTDFEGQALIEDG
jgi:hypothetical protein